MIEIKTVYPGLEQVPESYDVSSLQALIFEAVTTACIFLKERSVQIESDLHIKHILGDSAMDAVLVARAKIDMPVEEVIVEHLEIRKRIMPCSYGITISDDALKEMGDVIRLEVERFKAEFIKRYPDEYDEDVDIFVYREQLPCHRELAARLVHELWHLVEHSNGLLKSCELIHEGTAKYVEKRFLGSDPADIDYSNCSNPFWVLYDFAAKVVHEELGNDDFCRILDPDFRQRLVKRFNKDVLPLYFRVLCNHISDIERSQFLQNPHFAVFVKSPTHENLIAAYRATGLNKMADEVDVQDTFKYIEYLKECIRHKE